ncbi:hypothetical protein [Natrinema salifodinae]|uniref:Uncharacterized protein n=1 Tax=Natrinema salifodinae TaxID=1202768 RepID=A0A1I0QBH9_9EURY|nr:hypothetical protein [Natrinema salifodinae]SEW24393.1 hypothetical protein SAMN05216285_3345 [Natrinema salifodinae]
MHRRQYLTRTGAAASAGLLTGLAGCVDDLGESADDGSNGDVGSRAGERAIDRAAGELNQAARALDELDGFETPDDVEFDPDEPRSRLSAARDHLETAEDEFGEDRQADVETLRSYADALEGLIAVTVTVTDETIADDIDAVTAAIEEAGDVETASETVGERHAEITGARERFEGADETIRSLDGERLDGLAGIDLDNLEEGAAALGDVVTALETLAASYDATLDPDEGYGALERGRDRFENDEYEAAGDEFGTAESTFATARRRFETGREDAPEGLVEYFEAGACQTQHLEAAAAAFADAATAAADDDYVTAKRRRDDGEAELDDVGHCTD